MSTDNKLNTQNLVGEMVQLVKHSHYKDLNFRPRTHFLKAGGGSVSS